MKVRWTISRLARRLNAVIGTILICWLGLWIGLGDDQSLPTIVDIAVIKTLSDEQLAHMLPVRVQGVVTYFDPTSKSLFLQNPTGAIYVADLPGGTLPEIGSLLEVVGNPAPGHYAPIIRTLEVHPLGKGTLSPAPLVSLLHLSRGGFDSQRVQISGSIHSVRTNEGVIEATLWNGLISAKLIFQNDPWIDRLDNLNGKIVRVTGIAAPRVNDSRQAIGARLLVNSVEFLPSGELEAEIPVSSLATLLRYGSPDSVEPIRRVIGQITGILSASQFFLDDGSAGVLVILPSGHANQIGDVVEVIGATGVERRHGVLIGEHVRKIRKSISIPEFPITSGQEISNSKFYGRKVSLVATVLKATRIPSSDHLQLVLECSGQIVIGILQKVPPTYTIPDIGSKIEMKGVLEQDDYGNDSVRDLTLHASGLQDLQVISRPPVHWREILGGMVLCLGVGLVGISAWVMALRKQVACRTQTLKDKESDLQESLSAIELNRKWFMALVDNVPDAMWLKNPEGRYLAVNDAYRRVLRLGEVDIVGKLTQEILPPEIADRFLKEDAEMMQTRLPVEKEEQVLTTDNTSKWFELWKRAVLNSDGSILGTIGVARNINARKELEAQLRSLNAELEFRVSERTRQALDLYNNAPCGYHSLDSGGLVLAMNDTELSWLGYSRAELVGKMRYPELLATDEATSFPGLFRGFTQTGDSTIARWHMRRKDGTLFPVLVSVRAIRDDAGRFLRTQAMVVDYTDRERAETELRIAKDQAEASNRSKTIFLGNISHELRTPLNSVLGFAQLLLRESSLTVGQREFARTIYRNGEHLVDIIGEIIEMARLESGRAVLKPVDFDSYSLLEEIDLTFRERCRSKQLQMAVEPSPDLIRHLLGDVTKIRQVFLNLVGNAVKFTSKGGISIRLSSSLGQDGRIRLDGAIQDTGPGMSPDEVTHLFEPFFQTESGRSAGGTGLGLSITRQFLRMMDGDISISSEAGRGTCCQFHLQVLPGNLGKQGAPSPAPEFIPQRKWNQERVLVVDDEADNRTLLKCLLEPLGLSVELAADGAEAVSRFSARQHRFVLVDLQMPVMDGYEAMRQIRLQPSGTDCRVIALTAGAIALCRPQAIAAGADACLAKPVQIEALLEKLNAVDSGKYTENATDFVDLGQGKQEALVPNLSNVPATLLSSIASAALDADYPRLLEFCEEVQKCNPAVASQFRQMLSEFDYDAIVTECDRVALANGTSRLPDRAVQS